MDTILGSAINTAHIHLDNAVFRVHVNDTADFDLGRMVEADKKPTGVLWAGRSNDPSQNKTSLLVCVTEGYNLEEVAEWVESFRR